jgi:glycosyltransferase involved in cell wall biosynthesis
MESDEVKISWVIATRNRLGLLQLCLNRLMADCLEDEEILIADGNSSDGTKEYLQELYQNNKIHGFISEKDRNQAHAWNKLFVKAQGRYIKKLIDDDIVDFQAVRQCVNEMEKTPQADICISNDMSMSIERLGSLEKHSRLEAFQRWAKGEVPSFTFGDVHLIIRRTSIPLIGLYDTSFIMMDYEYSLRISYLKAGILYYTGYNALSISSNATVSSQVTRAVLDKEGIRANTMYEYAGDGSEISNWSRIKIMGGKLRDKVLGKQVILNSEKNHSLTKEEITEEYEKAWHKLKEINSAYPAQFYFSTGNSK